MLHIDRLRPLLVRAELAAAQDQLVTVLAWVPRDSALGGAAGLADRMPSAVGATFAAAQRVIDRVHRFGARVGPVAHVALPAGFADAHVDVIEVSELANRRAALALHAAHFAGRQDDDRILAFLRAQSSNAAGTAHELPALAGVHLDVVDFQPAGDGCQRQAI